MKLEIRDDSVTIEGYVNAIERNSKPIQSRLGKFIERICKGAFFDALKRNDDVHVLLNHDPERDLGSTKQGNLELNEDNIGLYARAEIRDPEVINDARHGDLVGWSFGFYDLDVDDSGTEDGMPLRKVRALDLREVSILNRKKSPAYDGTLIMARSDNDFQFIGEDYIDDVECNDLSEKADVESANEEQAEKRSANEEQPQQDYEHPEADKVIDYSEYEAMIGEMKGEN